MARSGDAGGTACHGSGMLFLVILMLAEFLNFSLRRRLTRTCLVLPALLLAVALTASAAITGQVQNGSNGDKPVQGAQVTLVQLQGTMQPVAHTTTDASGKFRFSQSTPAGQPMLVRVVYEGVPYFQPLPPGQTDATVEVFDASADASKLQLESIVMVVQPAGKWLAVIEQDEINNQEKRAYYKKGGLFQFRVPPGVKPDGARVIGPSGMPVAQEPKATGKPGIYTIDYPVRPGDNKIQISYRLPYDPQKASLTVTPIYPVAHFEVYVPTPMQFEGSAFKLLGEQQGYKVYDVSGGTAPYRFSVSGTAPMPDLGNGSANGNDNGSANGASAQSQPGSAQPAQEPVPGAGPDVGKTPQPTFLDKNLWVFAALLGMAAAAGFGILLSRPRAQAAGTAPEAPQTPAAPPAPALALGDDEMKKLKDDLFLLEVRRHTGNIDDAEYARLKQDLDQRMERLAGKIS